ncbi:hypothetical protein HMPREF1872_00743 [Amygdalobacter nucleatus]|uniref:Uncharacterized protein n=1 Tax=Amygdalobacter nucleatus TaxID=3029274 RepID=A0A133YCN6_9FIRM|nr:hypothetical protein HMPREF1872_00743 [Amygdalobacter nucleatus]
MELCETALTDRQTDRQHSLCLAAIFGDRNNCISTFNKQGLMPSFRQRFLLFLCQLNEKIRL